MAKKKGKVIVGMSGGVDSSVTAYLLQQEGWDVIGVFMKNWEDAFENPDYRDTSISGCSWEDDYADVRRVCDQLGIPYLTFNFVEEYKQLVFDSFLEELKKGRTPNPDIACNQEIKFHLFLKKALQVEGVTHVATGHYAKITEQEDGRYVLTRPADSNKDQTYFLYRIEPDVLEHVLFPLADLEKEEVRAIAAEQQFPNADKKDSTGICFIGDIDYGAFIDQYLEKKPGDIITTEGKVIGEHQGLHFYTIGQRKGINIGGTGPYFVAEKRMETNELVVTNNSNDPLLYQQECVVKEMHWLQTSEMPFRCDVQVRYRQQAQPAEITTSEHGVHIRFDEPQRAITVGQSAVVYVDDTVVGGGIIDATI